MNKLLWFAGGILVLAFLFPNGVPVGPPKPPVPDNVPVTPVVQPDPEIARLLSGAPTADKKRIQGIYEALVFVLKRDQMRPAGELVKTTAQWRELHGNTLDNAIEQVGKYPGLDVAIERVFKTTVGTDDVLPANAETRAKLIKAAEIVAASAR